ncbi:MAG: hypothetical protein HY788_20090 [Deltaproteobacteria bacterium]|nr:hypothetical protein [Deltaproteobacteria bacterium]
MGVIKDFLLQNLVPHFYAKAAERKIKKQQDLFEKENINFLANEDCDILRQALLSHNLKERERKRAIDDKAKASLSIVTLAITIVIASLSLLQNQKSIFDINPAALVLLIFGVIYLLLSGITSMTALSIRKFYDVYIDEIVEKSGDSYNIKVQSDIEIINKLYKYVRSNQMITNITANYIYATFAGIRNGIILIGAFFIISVGSVGIERVGKARYIDKLLTLINELANAGLIKHGINGLGYVLISLGALGMILLIICCPISMKNRYIELLDKRRFKATFCRLWFISWSLIMIGSILEILSVWF